MHSAPGITATSPSGPRVVLRDGDTGEWLFFESPRRLLVAYRPDEVQPLMREVADAVERDGSHAAGFVSYEAAPAFDACLSVRPDGEFPLLWFGLFGEPRRLATLEPPAGAGLPELAWRDSISRREYRSAVESIREYIRNGDTYQVNFTYRLGAMLSADPWAVFVGLMADHEMPYAAYVDIGAWSICSASPELFFRLDGERIDSRPMKGTAARGLWAEDDRRKAAELRASRKDQAENVMIVDMVRNDLGRVAATGTVHVPQLFTVERYPTVWQMTSTVSAQTTQPLDRIFQALFPPASITGVPKRRAMEVIAEAETTPRRVYTGAIGYAAPGRRAQFNVAIRTLLFDRARGSVEYGVGGGIVWDSEWSREREECAVKARVLSARRPEFDLLETLRWSPGEGYALLRHHLERLARSAGYFGFGLDLARVTDELALAASGLAGVAHMVRLLVSRRGNARCEARRLGPGAESFADLALAAAPVDREDVFLYHKTTHRSRYEKAVESCPGLQDVLLYNEAGEVTESTIANVAVERGGVLYTPPLRCGLLPGTYRAWMLEQQRLQERVLPIDDLLGSPNIYLMNSVRGIHKVRLIRCGVQEEPDRRLKESLH